MDLKTFLLARIEEDEAVAEACLGINQRAAMKNGESPRRWVIDGRIIRDEDTAREPAIPRVGHVWAREADHIARHDPARVLAECAAKRAIVEGWEDPATVPGWYGERGEGAAENLDGVVRTLAAVYADHPDYQPEWAV